MSKVIVCTSEAAVKKQVKIILDVIGCFWFMPPAGAFGKSGISDFLGVRNGKFFAIEAKFGDNKPTTQQLKFLKEVKEQGGLALVVWETNLADVWQVREL